ncbi:beta-1,4-galactosyltransferase galt-1-like [Haliotis cracherodii]|uniref:beta-1,4-galactosyltransferase galt-1-like n=1 Tax=Haliotis cracherodii TaxID=6455 RepID=UPI0039EBD0BC
MRVAKLQRYIAIGVVTYFVCSIMFYSFLKNSQDDKTTSEESQRENTIFKKQEPLRHLKAPRIPKRTVSNPLTEHCVQDPRYAVNLQYVHAKLTSLIFLFSAYADYRPEKPRVRIIGIINKNMAYTSLYCHYKVPVMTEDGSKIHELISVEAERYELCENHLRAFGGWILSCPLPEIQGRQPCFVYVGLSRKDTVNSVEMSILTTKKSQPEEQTDFAVCVPPLYGKLTRFSIVQFVELSRLLGARHFVFYDFGITPDVQLALKYYQSVGLASVIPWDLPVSWKTIWYLGQSVALTDCLYRHMSAVKYLMFNDLDEFLVPRDISARSWRDLTTMFKPNICGLSFRNAYFQINNLPACNQDNRCLTVLRATERHERFPNMGRNKMMVDPYKVFEMGIHHVSRPWPDVANYSVIEVPPDVAYVHHYRELQDDAMAERFTNDKFLVDTYSDPLIRMYSKALVAIRAFSRNKQNLV